MRSPRSRALAAMAAACLAVSLGVGSVAAAPPVRTHQLTACWDDGTSSGTSGVVGIQTWSGFTVSAASFGFANVAFGDFQTFMAAREGTVESGWLTPQLGGGALVGALLVGRHIVATDTIDEPAGGWDDLPACS